MKKVLSTLVAAIVAVAFAGVVLAADPAKVETETTTTSPAGDVKVEKKVVTEKSAAEIAAAKKAAAEKATSTTTTETTPAVK